MVVAADVHRLALHLGKFGHDGVFVLGQRIGQCAEAFPQIRVVGLRRAGYLDLSGVRWLHDCASDSSAS